MHHMTAYVVNTCTLGPMSLAGAWGSSMELRGMVLFAKPKENYDKLVMLIFQ